MPATSCIVRGRRGAIGRRSGPAPLLAGHLTGHRTRRSRPVGRLMRVQAAAGRGGPLVHRRWGAGRGCWRCGRRSAGRGAGARGRSSGPGAARGCRRVPGWWTRVAAPPVPRSEVRGGRRDRPDVPGGLTPASRPPRRQEPDLDGAALEVHGQGVDRVPAAPASSALGWVRRRRSSAKVRPPASASMAMRAAAPLANGETPRSLPGPRAGDPSHAPLLLDVDDQLVGVER